MANARAHLLISGEVQGVFYRASANEQADRLGLNGWVRNLWSGEVEAEIEGPESLVEEFIVWCRIGPLGARVDEVKVTKKTFTGEFTTFRVVR
jgi:acylphosphatase